VKRLPPAEAQPIIKSVLSAAEASDRLEKHYRKGFGRDCDTLPSAADLGLTAKEAGWWGRLRAEGLSPEDAADVVKAARQ
jgi:hypothetical protein